MANEVRICCGKQLIVPQKGHTTCPKCHKVHFGSKTSKGRK